MQDDCYLRINNALRKFIKENDFTTMDLLIIQIYFFYAVMKDAKISPLEFKEILRNHLFCLEDDLFDSLVQIANRMIAIVSENSQTLDEVLKEKYD